MYCTSRICCLGALGRALTGCVVCCYLAMRMCPILGIYMAVLCHMAYTAPHPQGHAPRVRYYITLTRWLSHYIYNTWQYKWPPAHIIVLRKTKFVFIVEFKFEIQGFGVGVWEGSIAELVPISLVCKLKAPNTADHCRWTLLVQPINDF